MVSQLQIISEKFVSKLIRIIGRPPKDSRNYNSCPHKDFWRTSLASPKLYMLTAHIYEFVKKAEECRIAEEKRIKRPRFN